MIQIYSISTFFQSISVSCHDDDPNVCDLHDLLSCHGRDDDGDVLHDRDDPYDRGDLHRSGACHDDPSCHDDDHGDQSDDDRPSCDARHVRHDVLHDARACDACLPYGGHRRSDDPCGSDPYGTSCGIRRSSLPCRDVCDDRVCLLYDDGRVHDACRDARVHHDVFCDRRHVRDDDLHDDVYRDHHVHLCGDDDGPCGLCGPSHHVHGGDGHGVPYHHLLHDDDHDD